MSEEIHLKKTNDGYYHATVSGWYGRGGISVTGDNLEDTLVALAEHLEESDHHL